MHFLLSMTVIYTITLSFVVHDISLFKFPKLFFIQLEFHSKPTVLSQKFFCSLFMTVLYAIKTLY
uniref:Uncharacterized protein n=1 Tax=Ciona intestinalis TaxID=7719 RepID=H2XUV3_CIOIN